jgi:4-hydroxythreonine-4-phosphate dehydrogenase
VTGGKPLVVTLGEPAGIGPDIVLLAWTRLHEEPTAAFAVLGDVDLLQSRAAQLGLHVPLTAIDDPAAATTGFRQSLPVLHRRAETLPTPGTIATANARFVTSLIAEAVDLALGGVVSGIVTGPIQKEALYGSGFRFEGHTDYLAALARAAGHPATPAMMLVAGDLRTVPVTVHIPLREVAEVLTAEAIVSQALVVSRDLRKWFAIAAPRIGVTGLNPHAGESGSIGREDIDVIVPALARLRAAGLDVTGPIPADTAFHAEARSRFDVIICMYHDQALIPVKTLDFHGGVNVTLGLPFIRTSPDHGTALSLAGTGKANPRSFMAALAMARQMAGP